MPEKDPTTWNAATWLLAHEKVYVRQSIRGLFIAHTLCYLMSDRYKLNCEVEAYREARVKHPRAVFQFQPQIRTVKKET